MFFSILVILRRKRGFKVGTKEQIWFRTIAVKICFFQSFFKQRVFLLKYYLYRKFQQNQTIFEGVRAKHPPSQRGCWIGTHKFNFFNSTVSNATLIFKIIKSFIYQKIEGITESSQEDINKKPLRKSQKISFLASFLQIFRLLQKP